MTTLVRERIITPSIRACPPNASEASSFAAAANAISNHEFHESYILLRAGFGRTCVPCLSMDFCCPAGEPVAHAHVHIWGKPKILVDYSLAGGRSKQCQGWHV